MSAGIRINSALFRELGELDGRQREAALHPGNVVVRAGPGSGKTRTLVARLAYTLETQNSRFRGAACITYTNAAAKEVSRRLKTLRVQVDRRLTCSTLHSFCLNEIIRPFASVTGQPLPSVGGVIDAAQSDLLLQRCYDEIGIYETPAKWRGAHITKIRRALASEAEIREFDPREVRAAEMFDRLLAEQGLIDFEAMVTRALNVVQGSEAVRDLLRAKYPELAVDEYQDLGGVLHGLVVALVDLAGIRVFAVGDVDQSVFGFTGADPRFLQELEERPDFLPIELEVNYRSGRDIITASEAALGTLRGRRAAVDAAAGNVELRRIEGALDDHGAETCAIVRQCLDAGTPPEKIAVLYPAKGPLLDALIGALETAGLPYLHEREDRLPAGSLSDFVQKLASRTVLSSQVHRQRSDEAATELLARSEAPDLTALAGHLARLRREAGIPDHSSRLALLRDIQAIVEPPVAHDPESPALEWLQLLDEKLELSLIGSLHVDLESQTAIQRIVELCANESLALQDLASSVEVIGKLVLTTYHSAKGREFSVVVLPGLLNEIVPRSVNDMGRWREPNVVEEAEQRRTFYVALSRAEDSAFLIVGPGYHTSNGYWRPSGPSKFVVDMARLLRETE